MRLSKNVIVNMIASRVALGILTLFAVSVLIFAATSILPGDAATAVLGQGATPETVAAYRHELGLDRPAVIRYAEWLGGVLHGDLGSSMITRRPIAETVVPRFENTLFLAGFAAVIAIPLAIFLGIVSAINEGKFIDRFVNIVSLGAISLPEFFIGYVLILFLAVKLTIFPPLATVFPEMGLGQRLFVTVLPVIALIMIVTAHMLRMTRSAVLSVLSQPYIEMAFLKGLKRRSVVISHALPNAAAPIINVVALNLAYLIVGVVVVEVVFVYPGLGQYMVDAVSKRDLPVVQTCALLFAATFVIVNALADILSVLINPRLRRSR